MKIADLASYESKLKMGRDLHDRMKRLSELRASDNLSITFGPMRKVDLYDNGLFVLTLQPGDAANKLRQAVRDALQLHHDQLAAALEDL